MEAFVSRKRKEGPADAAPTLIQDGGKDDDSTEVKLALLASMCLEIDTDVLLEALLVCDGSVELAAETFNPQDDADKPPRKKLVTSSTPGYQSSLSAFAGSGQSCNSSKLLTKKGRTLHLYSPEDIAAHTPCSIIHNFLPPDVADALLRELLVEAPTLSTDTFQLFDNVVTSPHTFGFYVDDLDEALKQKTEYVYNGSYVDDVRRTTPVMQQVSLVVRDTVNDEIKKRIISHYPDQRKLKFQSPNPWEPNTSFVNCYDGAKQNVGYHSDQLTYLGPRAIIGSISLGVAREFRVRKIVPRNTNFDPEDHEARKADEARADVEGQISIHLPHNSLLVMHAEMQEEWKHSIAPARAIEPHPIAKNKRLNITYRCYRENLHPKYTPKCKCGIPTVLRCVQKQKQSRGRYVWMCHTNYIPGRQGCAFFEWAVFDDDGEPPWSPCYTKLQPDEHSKVRISEITQ